MADFLLESTKRGARPELVQNMLVAENKKYEEDQKTLFKVADESERRSYNYFFYATLTTPVIISLGAASCTPL